MKLNLTTGQVVAIIFGILSAIAGATAQLTDVFGAPMAHAIVSLVNLVMTVVVAPVMFVITGQSSMVQAVQSMPGVKSIVVGSQANQTLAQLAIDPAQDKIEVSPEAKASIEKTAKGA